MPSPTSSTRPISWASIPGRYCSISLVRTEAISSALNLIAASLNQLVPEVSQAGADGTVVHPVADLDHQAAEQVRVDPGFQDRLPLESGAQLLLEALALVVGQRRGALDADADAVRPLLVEAAVGGQDRPEQVEPLVVIQDEEEVEEDVAGPPLEGRADHRRLALAADRPAGEEALELGRRREHVVDEGLQLVEHLLRLAALLGGGEQRLGVDAGDALGADVRDVLPRLVAVLVHGLSLLRR